MASKKITETLKQINAPQNIDNKLGYLKRLPYTLTEEQLTFCKAVYDSKNIGVFCNAKAGSSKTTLAIGMAMLMTLEYFMFDGIVYVISPCEENKLGFQPGTISDKTKSYMDPLYQALATWGYEPHKYVKDENNPESIKKGEAIIEAIPHTFLRGKNLSKKFVIIDEAQNYLLPDLKKTLTRIHDDCKCLIIGHQGQIDLKYPQDSGFTKYLENSRGKDFMETVSLTKNYRGKFSNWADEVI